MNDTEVQARVATLPLWARTYVSFLQGEPANLRAETAILQKRINHLEIANRKKQARIDAMAEMFQCAAKGGNEIAVAVQRITDDFLVDDEATQ